jgi:hypothetical protein
MQQTRRCIFCGARKVTKEHFWPSWCAPFFPRGGDDARVEVTYAQVGQGRLLAPARFVNRPGPVITKKIRVVCAPCNNIWMSRLETEVKPILIPMLLGEPVVLTQRQQRTLVEWIALKVMVAEFSRGDDIVISEEDRVVFKGSRQIPVGMQIWLGKCGEERWHSGLFRQAVILSLPHQSIDRSRKNTQTVTFGIGQLLVFVLLTRVPDLLRFSSQMLAKMEILWPLGHQDLSWPAKPALSVAEADHLAQSLDHLSGQPGVVWKPHPAPQHRREGRP